MSRIQLEGGLLVAFEGIDGSGKSLQARRLAETLERAGLDVVLTREPTDGPWGRVLRDSARRGRLSARDELDAFVNDRREHVAQVIRPALDGGQVVVVDRYYFSTAAYQGARGMDPEELVRVNEEFAPPPDVLFLIDVDPAVGLARIRGRDGREDLFERETELEQVARIFRALDRAYRVCLDGALPPEELARDIACHLYRGPLLRRLCLAPPPQQPCDAAGCPPSLKGRCLYPRLAALCPPGS